MDHSVWKTPCFIITITLSCIYNQRYETAFLSSVFAQESVCMGGKIKAIILIMTFMSLRSTPQLIFFSLFFFSSVTHFKLKVHLSYFFFFCCPVSAHKGGKPKIQEHSVHQFQVTLQNNASAGSLSQTSTAGRALFSFSAPVAQISCIISIVEVIKLTWATEAVHHIKMMFLLSLSSHFSALWFINLCVF